MTLSFGLSGVGLWMRGIESFAQFEATRDLSSLPSAEFNAPKPQAIPARERRRAGLMINLAVEVAHQACDAAGVDKRSIPSVFGSAMGDTAITDYMCRKLTAPEKLLSPTKFHNSVHNAASGYWTISAENRAPSTFVGAFTETFGACLFETVLTAQARGEPTLLVVYDIACSAPFTDIVPVSENFAMGLVVDPNDSQFTGEFLSDAGSRRQQPIDPVLQTLAASNPVANALTLLEGMAAQTPVEPLAFPAAPGAWFCLEQLA